MIVVNEKPNQGQPPCSTSKLHFRNKRRGATALEYLFMASLIIVVCVAAIQHLGSATKGYFKKSVDEITKSDQVSQLDVNVRASQGIAMPLRRRS